MSPILTPPPPRDCDKVAPSRKLDTRRKSRPHLIRRKTSAQHASLYSVAGGETRKPRSIAACGSFFTRVCARAMPFRRGFDTSLEALLPECSGVLMSDTGYLTPADLDDLDKVWDNTKPSGLGLRRFEG